MSGNTSSDMSYDIPGHMSVDTSHDVSYDMSDRLTCHLTCQYWHVRLQVRY